MTEPTHKLLAPTSEAPFGSLQELPTMIEPDLLHNEYYEKKYADHIASLKSYALTSGLKGFKVGDQVTEGVEFVIVHQFKTVVGWCSVAESTFNKEMERKKRMAAFPLNQRLEKEKVDTPVRIGGCFLGESCICKNKMDDFGKPVDYCANYSYNENVSPVKGIGETQEYFTPPDGENDWTYGAETFTRNEVYKLLWTQRAMITNDLKRYAGKDLTEDIYAVIDHPRQPKF